MRAPEANPSTLPQPNVSKRSFVVKLSNFFDAAKQMMTCTCTKVTWRFIQLCISLWQIADIVSDGFQTKKFWDLYWVSKNHWYKVAYVRDSSLWYLFLLNSAHGTSMSLPTAQEVKTQTSSIGPISFLACAYGF